jgi:hypothetical protein
MLQRGAARLSETHVRQMQEACERGNRVATLLFVNIDRESAEQI